MQLQTSVQISFFDNSKGHFEVCGRLQTPRSRGIPTALATIAVDAPTDSARERLLYGDSTGVACRDSVPPPDRDVGHPGRFDSCLGWWREPAPRVNGVLTHSLARDPTLHGVPLQEASSCCTRARGSTACR